MQGNLISNGDDDTHILTKVYSVIKFDGPHYSSSISKSFRKDMLCAMVFMVLKPRNTHLYIYMYIYIYIYIM